jgi:hypothetical protein
MKSALFLVSNKNEGTISILSLLFISNKKDYIFQIIFTTTPSLKTRCRGYRFGLK